MKNNYISYFISTIFIVLLMGKLSLQAQQLTEVETISIPGIQNGTVKWADYDNDGDLDFVLNGKTSYSFNQSTSKLFRNDGYDTFTEDTKLSLTTIDSGDTEWGDLDSDGDLEIFFSGNYKGDGFNALYKNEHNGLFKEYWAGLPYGVYCSMDWGDYDNDGDLDLLHTGKEWFDPTSKIYRNKGTGYFEEMGIDLMGVQEGAARWADFDNDGDLDMLIAGNYKCQIYFNKGNNTFRPDTISKIEGRSRCMADIGDYDNDGYLDFILSGEILSSTLKNKCTIYRNNRNGSFSEQTDIPIRGVCTGSVNWADFDNDGDLDFFITGYTDLYESYSAIYINQGNNVFAENNEAVIQLSKSTADWGDYDGDGDLDLLVSGFYPGNIVAKIYKNNSIATNLPPTAPKNLKSEVVNGEVNFMWSAATDDHTPKVALTYNLRIGTSKTGCEIASPMAISDLTDTQCGYRLIVRPGAINSEPKWSVKTLKTGKYYWQVQAIDQSFQGGCFSAIDSFEILEPTHQVSNIKIKDVMDNRVTLQWSNGNGQKTVVFATDGLSSYPVLNKGDKFEADSVLYGQSQSVVNSWHCLYNGYDSVCTVTGLSPDVSYRFVAYTYNNFNQTNYYLTSINNNTADLHILFLERQDSTIVQVQNGDADWGDFDGDGNIDLALSGIATTGRTSAVYRNNGDNSFSMLSSSDFLEGMGFSSVDWGDFNKDSKPDLLITGYYYAFKMTWDAEIYENMGDDFFFPLQSVTLPGAASSRSCWVDYNLDGYDDIFLSGTTAGSNYLTELYRNNKDNTFSRVTGSGLPIVIGGAAWADVNNDHLPDVVLTGADATFSNFFTKLYKNNGDDTFTEIVGVVANGGSGVDLHDLNNDGLPELLVGGRVFINHGGFSFTETLVYPESAKSPACFDYNGDGFLDLIYFNKQSSQLYLNNGDATFQQPIAFFLPNITLSHIDWADYDKDGDTDLFLIGADEKTKKPYSKILINARFSSSHVSPHLQSSNIEQGFNEENEYTLSWLNGSGQNRVVFMAPSKSEITLPLDNTTYNASPDWKTPIRVNGNCICVYNGPANNITLTNMEKGQQFAFEVFDYNGEQGHEKYNRATAFANPTDVVMSVEKLIDSQSAVSCYPNPATNKLTISYPDAFSEYIVALSDMSGNIVAKYSGCGKYLEMDVSMLNSGVYLVHLKDQFKSYRTKIVVVK